MIYSLTESIITDEEGVKHKAYGICAKDFGKRLSVSYPDIFFDKEQAENLVNLCNENSLEIFHLADVIEDVFTC